MSRWRKMGLLNLCWVSSDWSFFLLGGNRAFNFMLILSITAKCDLKTPSALSARTFMSACMCICVWVSNTEQVARAPSPRLNPAPSFLRQLMRYELLSLLPPSSSSFLSHSVFIADQISYFLFLSLPLFIHLSTPTFSLALPLPFFNSSSLPCLIPGCNNIRLTSGVLLSERLAEGAVQEFYLALLHFLWTRILRNYPSFPPSSPPLPSTPHPLPVSHFKGCPFEGSDMFSIHHEPYSQDPPSEWDPL